MADGDRRFHGLDLLRGVAALLVVAYHVGQQGSDRPVSGYLAVDLFFVLSGFVIALSYGERLARGLSIARFIEIRLVRLYPLYFAGWAIGLASAIVAYVAHDPRALTLPRLAVAAGLNLLMLPTPAQHEMFPLNGPAWSLFFEMVVNLAFAGMLWRASSRALAIVAGAAAVYLVLTVGPPEYFNIGWGWNSAIGGLARTMFAFPVGLLIHRHLGHAARGPSWLAIVPPIALAMVVVAAPALPARAAIELGAVLLLFPLLVYAGLRWETPPALRRTAGFLGDLSYPLYAIHWPLIPLLRPALGEVGGSAAATDAAVLGVLVVLSLVVARFFDAPVRRRLSDWLRVRRSAPPMVIDR